MTSWNPIHIKSNPKQRCHSRVLCPDCSVSHTQSPISTHEFCCQQITHTYSPTHLHTHTKHDRSNNLEASFTIKWHYDHQSWSHDDDISVTMLTRCGTSLTLRCVVYFLWIDCLRLWLNVCIEDERRWIKVCFGVGGESNRICIYAKYPGRRSCNVRWAQYTDQIFSSLPRSDLKKNCGLLKFWCALLRIGVDLVLI